MEYSNIYKNANELYYCSPLCKCSRFTFLMRLCCNEIIKVPVEDIKKYLVEHSGEIDQTNKYGWTALMIVARNNNIWSSSETIKLLLDYGANPNLRSNIKRTALMYAAKYGNSDSNFETVKLLLEKGADPNLQDEDGWTACMLAVKYSNILSNIKTIKLLIFERFRRYSNLYNLEKKFHKNHTLLKLSKSYKTARNRKITSENLG